MAATELVRASVTQVSPLKVRVDGAATANAAEALPGFVPVVGARVWAATIGTQLLVLAGGGGSAPTKAQIDALDVDADTLDGIDSTGFATAGHVHANGPWTALAYSGNWSEYSATYPARYRKLDNGLVVCKGLVKSTTSGGTIATFPVGFRPLEYQYLIAQTHDGANYVTAYMYLTPAGALVHAAGAINQISLVQLSWMAEQ